MNILGLKEAEVAPLVRAIAGDHLDGDALRERFARAAWTGIAEPGDRVAGILVGCLGAAAALDAGSGQLDGSDGSAVNRAAAEIIREIIEGGNSVRRRH